MNSLRKRLVIGLIGVGFAVTMLGSALSSVDVAEVSVPQAIDLMELAEEHESSSSGT